MALAGKVTGEYAEWFTTLIKEDLASATQVAQAVAALREEGPPLGRSLVDRLKGSTIHYLKENCAPDHAAARRSGSSSRSIPPGPRCSCSAATRPGNQQRWYRDNIPIAERLYLEYTTENEE